MATDSIDLWRQLKSHLESLRRAGLLDIPIGSWEPPALIKSILTQTSQAENLIDVSPVVAAVLRPPEAPRIEVVQKPAEPVSRPSTAPAKRPPSAAQPPVPSTFALYRKPFEMPVIPINERLQVLTSLAAEVACCERCPELASTRTQTVFQSGSPTARLMFVGEAPGADEDRLGEPFVGRAGQLVTDIITKGMGLSRSEVYIANVLKCRPPENRTPSNTEMANCVGYLDRQIEIVRPEFICLLGKVAVTALLQTSLPMKSLRQRWFRYREIPTMVTYHPAYLLRNPPAKKETWDDLKMLMKEMGISPPPKAS